MFEPPHPAIKALDENNLMAYLKDLNEAELIELFALIRNSSVSNTNIGAKYIKLLKVLDIYYPLKGHQHYINDTLFTTDYLEENLQILRECLNSLTLVRDNGCKLILGDNVSVIMNVNHLRYVNDFMSLFPKGCKLILTVRPSKKVQHAFTSLQDYSFGIEINSTPDKTSTLEIISKYDISKHTRELLNHIVTPANIRLSINTTGPTTAITSTQLQTRVTQLQTVLPQDFQIEFKDIDIIFAVQNTQLQGEAYANPTKKVYVEDNIANNIICTLIIDMTNAKENNSLIYRSMHEGRFSESLSDFFNFLTRYQLNITLENASTIPGVIKYIDHQKKMALVLKNFIFYAHSTTELTHYLKNKDFGEHREVPPVQKLVILKPVITSQWAITAVIASIKSLFTITAFVLDDEVILNAEEKRQINEILLRNTAVPRVIEELNSLMTEVSLSLGSAESQQSTTPDSYLLQLLDIFKRLNSYSEYYEHFDSKIIILKIQKSLYPLFAKCIEIVKQNKDALNQSFILNIISEAQTHSEKIAFNPIDYLVIHAKYIFLCCIELYFRTTFVTLDNFDKSLELARTAIPLKREDGNNFILHCYKSLLASFYLLMNNISIAQLKDEEKTKIEQFIKLANTLTSEAALEMHTRRQLSTQYIIFALKNFIIPCAIDDFNSSTTAWIGLSRKMRPESFKNLLDEASNDFAKLTKLCQMIYELNKSMLGENPFYIKLLGDHILPTLNKLQHMPVSAPQPIKFTLDVSASPPPATTGRNYHASGTNIVRPILRVSFADTASNDGSLSEPTTITARDRISTRIPPIVAAPSSILPHGTMFRENTGSDLIPPYSSQNGNTGQSLDSVNVGGISARK